MEIKSHNLLRNTSAHLRLCTRTSSALAGVPEDHKIRSYIGHSSPSVQQVSPKFIFMYTVHYSPGNLPTRVPTQPQEQCRHRRHFGGLVICGEGTTMEGEGRNTGGEEVRKRVARGLCDRREILYLVELGETAIAETFL